MNKTRVITFVGMLSALSFILYLFEFPLFTFFPPYLKVDISDVPAILGAIAAGPVAGVAIELVKNLLHFALRSSTGGIGEIANFFAGVGFLLPICLIVRKQKKNSIIAYVLGTVSMVVVVNVINYFITLPLYGIPKEAIPATVFNVLVPFNLVKAVIVSIVTIVLYTSLRRQLEKFMR